MNLLIQQSALQRPPVRYPDGQLPIETGLDPYLSVSFSFKFPAILSIPLSPVLLGLLQLFRHSSATPREVTTLISKRWSKCVHFCIWIAVFASISCSNTKVIQLSICIVKDELYSLIDIVLIFLKNCKMCARFCFYAIHLFIGLFIIFIETFKNDAMITK